MTCDDPIERVLYLLNLNLPHRLITSLLNLRDEPSLLHEVWEVWSLAEYDLLKDGHGRVKFMTAVEQVTGYSLVTCDDCDEIEWLDDTTVTTIGTVCDHHLHRYSRCGGCNVYTPDGDITYVEGHNYCESCTEDRCHWCEDCEQWYRSEHSHGCDCEAPHLDFEFPANGHGTITNDERLNRDPPRWCHRRGRPLAHPQPAHQRRSRLHDRHEGGRAGR